MKEDQRKSSMLKEYSHRDIQANADLRKDFASTRTVTGAQPDPDAVRHADYWPVRIPRITDYVKV